MIMKNLKNIAIASVLILSGTVSATAQEKVEGSISADVVSQYIWRGQDFGDVSFQPSLGLSYAGFSLSAWGSIGLSNEADATEFDLTLAYAVGGFNLGITDYWTNTGAKYFQYESHKTNHVFEANVGYDFGPCSIQWYTNFAGADGTDKDGCRAYSSYVELGAPFKLGGLNWDAAVGIVPYQTSFYADANGFAVTNVSVKATYTIEITPSFSLPVFACIATNPSSEDAAFVFGFTLRP